MSACPDCRIEYESRGRRRAGLTPRIVFCPMHESAAEMHKALTNLVRLVENADGIHRVRMSGTLASAHYALTVAGGQKAMSL